MLAAYIDGRQVVRGSRMFSQVHGWGTVAVVRHDRIKFLPDDARYRHQYAFTRTGHHIKHYNGQVLFWTDRKDGDVGLVKPSIGVPMSVVKAVNGNAVSAVRDPKQPNRPNVSRAAQAFYEVAAHQASKKVAAKQVPFYQMIYKDKNGRFGMSKVHYQSVVQAQAALEKVIPGARIEYPYLASRIMVNV